MLTIVVQIYQHHLVDNQQLWVLLPRVLKGSLFKVLPGGSCIQRRVSFSFLHGRCALIPSIVIQIMISQAIVGYRTWTITKRSKDMGISLFIFGLLITVLEWYSNFEGRTPAQKPPPSNPSAQTGKWASTPA